MAIIQTLVEWVQGGVTDTPRVNIAGALVGSVKQWAFSGFVHADTAPLNEKGRAGPLPGMEKQRDPERNPFEKSCTVNNQGCTDSSLSSSGPGQGLLEVKTDPQLCAFSKAPSILKCDEICPSPPKKKVTENCGIF